MGIGSVNVVAVDNKGGVPLEFERVWMFVAKSASSEQVDTDCISVNMQSDWTKLGVIELHAKALDLSRQNAKNTNWYAKLLIVPQDATIKEQAEAVDFAFATGVNVEDVAFLTAIETRDELVDVNAKFSEIRSKYSVFTNAHCAVALANGETLAGDISAVKAMINDLVADYVSVTIAFGSEKNPALLGVVTGRLCNPAVTVADSPMRVRTGSIVGMEMPEVSNGVFTMAEVKDLADARFSMPQYYNGYEGIYWTDHQQLATKDSDFLNYENRRVVDYLSRRIYVKLVSKMADRTLNETPTAIERAKTFFAKTLKDASQKCVIGGEEQPGLVDAATDGDVTIQWENKYKVRVDFKARPLACPKEILASIGLDLSLKK